MDLVSMGHILYDVRCYVKDFPVPDKTSFIYSQIENSVGGSGTNVAMAARSLGLKTGLMGNVGSDPEGGRLIQHLLKHGVDIARLRVVDGHSGKAIVMINSKADVEVVEMLGVNEPFGAVDPAYVANAKYLFMSGTSIAALEEASLYAKKSGVEVVFDPGRSKSRMGLAKLGKILQNSSYLIINRAELAFLTGKNDVHAGISLVRKTHPCVTCIIKSGSKPVIVEGEEKFEVAPFKVKAIDTLGAGDCFCAGFITALRYGKSLRDAVKFANAVAAVKVTRRGAHNVPSREEVMKMKQFKLR
ncbi:MAG: carbohydrate kinase family protein [Candidatus Micrarchaeota archaeon]|nr:carbohydrate kinase family protein [Candidatus Micrarchaeota archaeon]